MVTSDTTAGDRQESVKLPQSPHLGISDLPSLPAQRISCLFSKDSPHLKYLQSGVIES